MTFKVQMEQGLAEAFNLAFQAQEQAGRRRRKRYVQIGKAGVNVRTVRLIINGCYIHVFGV